ncbi:cyclin-D3-3 [Lathyrus oleraceus]|uniref:cyclin-D3-3 n=1 Tax=Pisum sativum TaxID=3888 RepID=UPI0021D124C7|nr:cyclin-D3-3-like [Pisum sativum]
MMKHELKFRKLIKASFVLQVVECLSAIRVLSIHRVELLILSTLKWKTHPVTPHSFLDHIITRLGLKTNLHWEFLRCCENLLPSVLLDSRFVGCVPSVLVTATMLHVIDQTEESDDNGVDYKNQLLSILKINKEKVDECYNAIVEVTNENNYGHKRKYEQIHGSASGVIDAVFSSDGSIDSWKVGSSSYSTSEPIFKKTKTQRQNRNLSPLNRAIVGILATAATNHPNPLMSATATGNSVRPSSQENLSSTETK